MKFWAGGGVFVRYTTLPLPLAWDAFGIKNGALSYRALQNMIGQLRSHDDGRTPEIGCSILAEPFFWDQEDWIPIGDDFARNIVAGKTFDSIEPAGARLWNEVQLRLESLVGMSQTVAETMHGPMFLHDSSNGLLLRSDFHRLFDAGLVTVTPEHRVQVSERIREHWFNGKVYYRLQDQTLASLPENPRDQPSSDLLRWHNENVFERVGDYAG